MNRANRRSSTWIQLCARLTLAAFAAALPGPAAWAQAVERVVPVTAPPAALGSAALAAPSVLSGSSLSSLRAAPLAPTALSAAPLAAPMAAAAPLAAAPALAAAAAPSAAIEAAQAAVPAALTAAAPAHVSAATPAERAEAPAVTAVESLNLIGGDARSGSAGRNAIVRYDGGRGGSDGDDGNGGGRAPLPSPSQAPVVALTKVFFPGTGAIRLNVNSQDFVSIINAAIRGGGYAVAATVGKDTAQGHNSLATLVKITIDRTGAKPAVEMTVLRPVKIDGYDKTAEGVALAKVSYPQSQPSDPSRLSDLGSLAQHVVEQFAALDPEIPANVVSRIMDESSVERLTGLISQNMPFSLPVQLSLLAAPSTEARLQAAILEMTAHFKAKTAKAQAAANGDQAKNPLESVETLKAKMAAIGMPEAIQATMTKEYEKYSQMNPKDSEAQKNRTYLEWMLDMPWGQRTEDKLDIAQARATLDADHSGLDVVKERVLEFLALRKKTGSKKGAIIAFTGPPGVGKTSIAAAIAQALGRKFVRLSLGGVHDESVLRGHGRTYVGSMPGEIMRQMKNAGTINPVMLLDEADKLGRNGNQGDPTAALLEILDPAQNNTYRDRYLDVPYDLSEVLFVVTSNELSNIPEPLRDRMEIIEFDGYTTLEKMAIAEQHIIPQKLGIAGLTDADAKLTPAAIRRVIEGYTMEAGVRSLREKIEAIMRKVSAWTETKGEKTPGVIDEKDVAKYLGVPRFSARQTAQNGVGVATGLAVNTYGGSTLNVEVSYEPGSGQLKLRKQFGDDIEDSAKNAYKYVKTHAQQYGLDHIDFTKIDLDLDLTPAGKVDGPSAGGLMVTAIISALTGRSVAPGLAMTGEITMRGDILPIGGLKQKVMAAHRMGYKEVIFPYANLKDIESIPQEVRDGIILTPAKTYDDIYPHAVVKEVTGVPASTPAPAAAAPSAPVTFVAAPAPAKAESWGFGARIMAILRALNPWSTRR
ncbi:MAG TPA: endopeptidase La [Elusimicrobiota bacterium]|nr:endopeptidase La [Elusimicrobiota bacterium]